MKFARSRTIGMDNLIISYIQENSTFRGENCTCGSGQASANGDFVPVSRQFPGRLSGARGELTPFSENTLSDRQFPFITLRA